MIEFLTSPELWIALLTLATLEIVLGVDNLVFISIAVSKLPPEQRPKARKFGLALACVTRILLLLTRAWTWCCSACSATRSRSAISS
jgi:predicted tellurium resistance membrane protein TerC